MAYIKLNQENLYYNINQLALKTGNIEKIAAVLKDNAYGHGLEEMAKLVSSYGIKRAVVVNVKEAYKIKELFDSILILNANPIVAPNFSFAITEIAQLKKLTKGVKVELKVDTGMHRNGISLSQLPRALEIIKEKSINLKAIFTHFKSADIFSSELAWQMQNWDDVKKIATFAGFKDIEFHSQNSAALLRSNSFDDDYARVGIAMYGYNELPDIYDKIELKPVVSLWAKRVSTRLLKKGQRVGYGGNFRAKKDMIVSTYDLGYGDGWFRGDANKPYITPEGLPILGTVSMDFISLESTKDELCIFNNAQDAARHFNTISYEIITKLSPNLKREIV